MYFTTPADIFVVSRRYVHYKLEQFKTKTELVPSVAILFKSKNEKVYYIHNLYDISLCQSRTCKSRIRKQAFFAVTTTL